MGFENQIEGEWLRQLSPFLKNDQMERLFQFLKKESSQKKIIFPKESERFNAFKYTPFSKVKVVILGQDPYHGVGEATGLSFSVKDGVKIPPSLKNIIKELQLEYNYPPPTSGNLQPWAKEGVLLLNTVLTVEKDRPASHQKQGWEAFTDHVIETLSEKRDHLIFILWGEFAKKKITLIDKNRHLILTAPHPSPLSASRGFLGCNHFKLTNEYLVKNGKTPVEWRLN